MTVCMCTIPSGLSVGTCGLQWVVLCRELLPRLGGGGACWRKWITGVGLKCKCRVIVQSLVLGGALCFLVNQELAGPPAPASLVEPSAAMPPFHELSPTVSHRNLSNSSVRKANAPPTPLNFQMDNRPRAVKKLRQNYGV